MELAVENLLEENFDVADKNDKSTTSFHEYSYNDAPPNGPAGIPSSNNLYSNSSDKTPEKEKDVIDIATLKQKSLKSILS